MTKHSANDRRWRPVRPPAEERKNTLRKHVARQLRYGTANYFYDLSEALVAASAELARVPRSAAMIDDVQWECPTLVLKQIEGSGMPAWIEDNEQLWHYAGGKYSAVEVGVGGHAYLSCHELGGRDYWLDSQGLLSPAVPTKLASRVRRVKQFIKVNDVGAWEADGTPLVFDEDLHTLRGLPAAVIKDIRQARLRSPRRSWPVEPSEQGALS